MAVVFARLGEAATPGIATLIATTWIHDGLRGGHVTVAAADLDYMATGRRLEPNRPPHPSGNPLNRTALRAPELTPPDCWPIVRGLLN